MLYSSLSPWADVFLFSTLDAIVAFLCLIPFPSRWKLLFYRLDGRVGSWQSSCLFYCSCSSFPSNGGFLVYLTLPQIIFMYSPPIPNSGFMKKSLLVANAPVCSPQQFGTFKLAHFFIRNILNLVIH